MKLTQAFMGLDIETVPDLELFVLKNPNLASLSLPLIEEAFNKSIADKVTGELTFPRTIWHKPVSVSMTIWDRENGITVASEGPDCSEKELVQFFLTALDKYQGASNMRIFTFNGNMFDLNVLRIRCLKYRLDASSYLDFGQKQEGSRWAAYGNRYHFAHIDVLDFMRNFFMASPCRMSLQELSLMCNLPGKIGMGGDKVYDAYKEKKFTEIQQYCDVDSFLTLLLGYDVLRMCHGELPRYKAFMPDLRDFLDSDFSEHKGFTEFKEKFNVENWIHR